MTENARRGWPNGRISKRMQRDATAVPIVHAGGKVGRFAEHQQLVEWAPLMRMPLGGPLEEG